MKKITIAIDGFSSTGKSTIAKQLANKLNYVYVDTGAMYRAVTLYAMRNDFISEKQFDSIKLEAKLHKVNLEFRFNPELEISEIHLNNENVEKYIRTLEVSNFVSIIAANSAVRHKLVEQQQEMGKEKGVVMDGRDIGTVVFPNADLKLFMTASAEVRALRRYEELLNRGDDVNYDEVLKNVVKRDYIDSNREDSPLIKAKDAIEIDNSNLSLEEQFEKILNLVKSIINKEKNA
ncbi:(d)CMP kinase [Flavobacteriaceae bacterium AU392]|nr:(d)CMP kinase [Flavobacteriaceae bacterium]RKM85748.1 (d)CMP kinase [Flavobacteriaceae bacterium AU392]